MQNIEKQQAEMLRRLSESREISFEDDKEKQEARKAAARERAEKTSTEIKSTKKQMQNITTNMQQVIKAVKLLRAQLGLMDDEEIPSIKRDNEELKRLKDKISELTSQFDDLKTALFQEEKENIKRQNPLLSEAEVEGVVTEKINNLIKTLELESGCG